MLVFEIVSCLRHCRNFEMKSGHPCINGARSIFFTILLCSDGESANCTSGKVAPAEQGRIESEARLQQCGKDEFIFRGRMPNLRGRMACFWGRRGLLGSKRKKSRPILTNRSAYQKPKILCL